MKKFLYDNGSVVVLVLLCLYYAIATVDTIYPVGPAAGRQLARQLVAAYGDSTEVMVVVGESASEREFAEAVRSELESSGAAVHVLLADKPATVRQGLVEFASGRQKMDAIATHHAGMQWGPLQADRLQALASEVPALRDVKVHEPRSYRWPTFFTQANLINVINQNSAIFIIAIGMTMVIICAGIDLSVGSLVALAAVVVAIVAEKVSAGQPVSTPAMLLCCAAGVLMCALWGMGSGIVSTYFRVPAFIVTLAIMSMARGLAFTLAGSPEGISIDSAFLTELGTGRTMGIPNPILVMIVLYSASHIFMTRTRFGRYIYAVGGNPEAARLSGVPVKGILVMVYAAGGALTGLAGVIETARFESGDPKLGEGFELQVIAAVVVGGTSLFGGEGRIVGTLVGALIIAVIDNGLNMAGVDSYAQMIVFGLLILAAALLEQLKKYAWKRMSAK